jgi:hypothetical protein
MHECPEGHELGYNPTGNKRIQCDHCEGNMNGRKHWSCRTCDYDVCEECV